ncbi:MAG TPA: branched-chain amino acid ABC transporter permease [Chloroflexota bacterium]|nr:branched-chain amino acid ABC transporter permease [Chloroflexota bacterium]
MADIIIAGLALGALYAIVALGYTMVYGIIELINFAHGDVFTLGGFIAIPILGRLINQNSFTVSTTESIIGIGVAMIVAAIVCAAVGVFIELVAYRPLRNAPKLAPLITAIGVSLILENAMYQWQGGLPVYAPNNIVQTSNYTFLGVTITNIQILVIVIAVLMMLGLDFFVNQTRLGKAMRAVAQDREAASMMGINVNRIISITFLIGSGLAGAGAVIYLILEGSVGYNSGFTLGLFAFTAAVLGGIGNIRGAMMGGFLIGLITAYVQSLGNGGGTEWYDVVVFAILVLILVFRPAGLLGTNTTEKV